MAATTYIATRNIRHGFQGKNGVESVDLKPGDKYKAEPTEVAALLECGALVEAKADK